MEVIEEPTMREIHYLDKQSWDREKQLSQNFEEIKEQDTTSIIICIPCKVFKLAKNDDY